MNAYIISPKVFIMCDALMRSESIEWNGYHVPNFAHLYELQCWTE